MEDHQNGALHLKTSASIYSVAMTVRCTYHCAMVGAIWDDTSESGGEVPSGPLKNVKPCKSITYKVFDLMPHM
ncbi:hypothetical protein [Flavilitoribacter nigricans]|uniref:hypothetical protein n=1 Tax=Flavilitoribacter nigricans TaxID=70997 RepID=UPI001473AD9B|nr:hypothetical protein [Flavilitoribacter nigricans]